MSRNFPPHCHGTPLPTEPAFCRRPCVASRLSDANHRNFHTHRRIAQEPRPASPPAPPTPPPARSYVLSSNWGMPRRSIPPPARLFRPSWAEPVLAPSFSYTRSAWKQPWLRRATAPAMLLKGKTPGPLPISRASKLFHHRASLFAQIDPDLFFMRHLHDIFGFAHDKTYYAIEIHHLKWPWPWQASARDVVLRSEPWRGRHGTTDGLRGGWDGQVE